MDTNWSQGYLETLEGFTARIPGNTHLGRYQVSAKDTVGPEPTVGSTEFVSSGYWGYVHCW